MSFSPSSSLRRLRIFVFACFTLCAAFSADTFAQNIQHADKNLDLGMRSNVRVHPITRAVNFEIPLGHFPGRAGHNIPVTLSYSSKVWNIDYQGYNPGPPPPHGGMQPFTIVTTRYSKRSMSGWTSSVSGPSIDSEPGSHMYDLNGTPRAMGYCVAPCFVIDRKTVWMPDGSSHEIRASDQPRNITAPAPDHFYAVDGTGMRYQASTGTLFLADGSRYANGHIDRNGNKLTSNGSGYVDTLGRTINNPLAGGGFVGDQNYSIPGVNGTPQNYVFKWRNLADVLTTPAPLRYMANGGCPPATGGSFSPFLFASDYSFSATCIGNASVLFNPVVLHQIVMPNGQSYTFTYNVYGEIDKIVLPTGGYERYNYSQVPSLSTLGAVYAQANRGVTSQFISPSGSGTDEVQWTYTGSPGNVTITEPGGARTELFFWTDGNSSWGFSSNGARAGNIYDERIFSASGQMLRRKLTDWAMTGSNAAGNFPGTLIANRNARVVRAVELILDTGGNALAKSTTTSYDTTYQFTVGIEQTSVSEYNFVSIDPNTAQTLPIGSLSSIPNGTLIRTTITSSLTSNQNYRDRNILGLPTVVSVYNGTGGLVSQTTFAYDEAAYPLISVPGTHASWVDPATTVRGNATTKSVWLNTTGTFLQTHSQYDQFGNVRYTWDARQKQSQINYSSTYSFAYATEAISPDPDGGGPLTSLTTTSEYDLSTGRVTATIDPNGQRTTFSYADPLNRLKQIVRASTDLSAKMQATYVYDDVGRKVTFTSDLNNFDDNIIKTETLFDGQGRTIETRQYETPSNFIAINTEYDTHGRPFRTSNPYRPGETVVWTTTVYDALGRTLTITTPDSAVFRTDFSGDRVLVTDPAGKQRITRTNSLGQLKDVWEVKAPDAQTEAISFPGHPEVTAGYRTSYEYTAMNSLSRVTQGSQQRIFMYDSLQRMLRARHPEQTIHPPLNVTDPVTGNSSWTEAYLHDENGNLIQRTDARGVVSNYVYDSINRNITIDHSDTPINPDVKRFYDGAANGKGRFWYFYSGGDFSNGDNVDHTSIDGYDALGRPLVMRQMFKLNGTWGPTYQVSRTYNKSGGVSTQIYPSGHSVAYTYDGAGRPYSLSGNLGDGAQRTYATGINYSQWGTLRSEQFGTTTPVYRKHHYNIRGQLFDVRASNVNDEWGGELGALVNYYSTLWAHGGSGPDNNGNILMSQTIINSYYMEDRYLYDALNRLESVAEYQNGATHTGTQQYTYDRWGNRTINPASWGTGINVKQFSVDTATNRLGVPSGQSGNMTYDNAGNLINDTYTGVGARTYDADNRMLTAADNTGQLSRYTYDGDGKRVRRKIASSQEQWQIYGFDSDLLAEYAASAPASAPEKEYGYRNGQMLVTASGRFNVALAANGAVATASSAHTCCGFSTTGAINNNNRGPWGLGEGWNDATDWAVPDWIQVDFSGSKTIDEISVFSLHDNYTAENTPTPTQTFSLYGLLSFTVQYWNGSTWLTVPGGSVTGNNLVWRKFTFSPVTTDKIRVWISAVPDAWSRVVEIQAFGTSAGGEKIQWLVSDHLNTPRIIIDETGTLANVKRHDYLPFGEELGAGVGGRTTALGYEGADGIRQQFTSQERDTETGLDFFEARYYSSIQGRFLSFDPLLASARRQTPQSWNRYSHAINNPLKYADPSGEGWVRGIHGDVFWDPEVSTQKQVTKKYGRGYTLVDGKQLVIRKTFPGSGFRVGHYYTFNSNGTVTHHGVYFPPPRPIIRFSTQYGDEMALEMIKLYGKAAMIVLTGGTGFIGMAIGTAGLAAELFVPEDEPDPAIAAMAANITISPIADDWITKGAHIKVDGVELKLLPGKDGEMVIKSVFSSTPEAQVQEATKKTQEALTDPAFRERLTKTVGRAVKHFGKHAAQAARAKSGELRFLLIILRKGR